MVLQECAEAGITSGAEDYIMAYDITEYEGWCVGRVWHQDGELLLH